MGLSALHCKIKNDTMKKKPNEVTVLSMKKLGAVLLCLCLLLPFCACGKKLPKTANKDFTYQISEEPKTLDPQVASDSGALIAIEALYEGLARLDAKGEAYPGVAEKWVSNSSRTEFTFTLRQDAKWADKNGTPVTAQDFVYAFRRALDPATGSKTCAPLFAIKNAEKIHSGQLGTASLGVSAKDDHTLVVELEYADPDFPALTALAVFMPCNETFFKSTDGRYGLDYKYLLGNGPFEIDGKYGWEHDVSISMARSDTYTGNSTPLPSSLKLTIEGTDNKITDPVSALTSKKVDAIGLTSSQADDAEAAGCTLTSFQNITWGLCFNTQSGLMKNQKVRTAFVQALNRSALLKLLPKGTTAASSVICPSVSLDGNKYLSLIGNRTFFLKQSSSAASLLSAGLAELPGQDLKNVSVLCPDNSSVKLVINQMIADWNSKFNSYFSMEPLDDDTLAQRIKTGNYQMAVCPIQPDSGDPYGTLSLFRSGETSNPARFSSADFDATLAAARMKTGSSALSGYMDAETILSSQAVFYPLYYDKTYYASAEGVTGIIFHPFSDAIDFIQAGKD